MSNTPGTQPAEANEFEQLEFMIESCEQDIKNMTFSVNSALGAARRSDDEEMPGLAHLWRGRADDLNADLKAKREAVRAAKEQRRKLMSTARFDPAAE